MKKRSQKSSAPARNALPEVTVPLHAGRQSVAGVNPVRDVAGGPARNGKEETITTRRMKRAIAAASGEPVIRTFRVNLKKKLLQPKKESLSMQDHLNKERLREITIKHLLRNFIAAYFLLLLFLQNGAVFYIVYRSLVEGGLKDLQLIFATLVTATLTETYFITKIIVNFVFGSTDYTAVPPGITDRT